MFPGKSQLLAKHLYLRLLLGEELAEDEGINGLLLVDVGGLVSISDMREVH